MPITIQKCPICNEEFDSGGKPQRVYCNPRCRAKAAKLKEKEKYQEAIAKEKAKEEGVIWNPTRELLDRYAGVALADGLAVPIYFAGAIPVWQAPPGVSWIYHEAIDELPARWGMSKEEEDLSGVYLKSLGGIK